MADGIRMDTELYPPTNQEEACAYDEGKPDLAHKHTQLTNQDYSKLVLATLLYDSCVEKNDPTPGVLAIQIVPKFLLQASQLKLGPEEKEKNIESFMESALLPFEKVSKSTHADLEATIRNIEIQVLLRMQFWASMGKRFVRLYKQKFLKCNKHKPHRKGSRSQKKKEKTNAGLHIRNDIIDLLSMAAMKLPEKRPFSFFLQGCLDTRISSQPNSVLPNGLYKEIYDKFEINNPESPEKQDYIPITLKAIQEQKFVDEMAKGGKEEQPQTTNNGGKVKSSIPKVEKGEASGKINSTRHVKDSSLVSNVKPMILPQAVTLVAPVGRKRNSLLSNGKNQRSQFVGSHFNTNLSNMNTLFREVKTQSKQPCISKAQKQGDKPTKALKTQMATKLVSERSQTKGKRKQAQCFHVADEAYPLKKKKAVKETPMKRGGNLSRTKLQSARHVVFAGAAKALKRQN